MNQQDEDLFFEALAGRGTHGPVGAFARTLREEIKHRAEIAREAAKTHHRDSAKATEVSVRQQALLGELKARNVFSDVAAPENLNKPARSTPQRNLS